MLLFLKKHQRCALSSRGPGASFPNLSSTLSPLHVLFVYLTADVTAARIVTGTAIVAVSVIAAAAASAAVSAVAAAAVTAAAAATVAAAAAGTASATIGTRSAAAAPAARVPVMTTAASEIAMMTMVARSVAMTVMMRGSEALRMIGSVIGMRTTRITTGMVMMQVMTGRGRMRETVRRRERMMIELAGVAGVE